MAFPAALQIRHTAYLFLQPQRSLRKFLYITVRSHEGNHTSLCDTNKPRLCFNLIYKTVVSLCVCTSCSLYVTITRPSLPPANEVCEGYVFTGVFLSTGGGRACHMTNQYISRCIAAGSQLVWRQHTGNIKCMTG